MKMFVSFGTDHHHKVGESLLHTHTVAVIDCLDHSQGRQIAFLLFGTLFCTTYHDELPDGFDRFGVHEHIPMPLGCEVPMLESRWVRTEPHDPIMGSYNGYTVIGITNTRNYHEAHPPQVIYRGDNGKLWSLPLDLWPGSLKPEERCPTCGGTGTIESGASAVDINDHVPPVPCPMCGMRENIQCLT